MEVTNNNSAKPIINNLDDFKSFSPYKYGLYRQRELFKQASYGQGQPNFDLMSDCIQNLKCDLKDRMIMEDMVEDLKHVEEIIFWYRTLEQKYIKNTEEGPRVILPGNINVRVNKNLTVAYEILMKFMNRVGLLE